MLENIAELMTMCVTQAETLGKVNEEAKKKRNEGLENKRKWSIQ
jgi:hypothetical protein